LAGSVGSRVGPEGAGGDFCCGVGSASGLL
jgi:hypothetical protein